MRRRHPLLWLLLGIGLAFAIGCRMNQPPPLGAPQGRLLPCPGSPNCVCSQDADPDHQIAPLTYSGTAGNAFAGLKQLVASQPRAKITEESPGYLRAEFRSKIFRFVDDVEFLLDEPRRVIHVRSASRVGYSDLGVNRQRVERLRTAWQAAGH